MKCDIIFHIFHIFPYILYVKILGKVPKIFLVACAKIDFPMIHITYETRGRVAHVAKEDSRVGKQDEGG